MLLNGTWNMLMRYGILDWTGSPKLGFYALKRSIVELKRHRGIL